MTVEFKLENKSEILISNIRDFCFSNGLIFFKQDNKINEKSNDLASNLPVTLFPTPFPISEFQFAQSIQNDFQQLIFNISKDYEFLKETLKTVILVDDFTRRLWEIYEKIHSEGAAQPISLAIIRNDYMLDQNKAKEKNLTQLSQIEINTISCSFGAATSKVSELHEYSLKITDNQKHLSKLVKNNNLQSIAKGLVNAWKMYDNENAIMVFLVIDFERNIGDQRLLEYECLKQNPKCKVIRYTITDFAERGRLDENKRLIMSCYDPSHLKRDKDWDARLLIERSMAIKCPNIQLHLVGAKIVQTALFKPNVVEKFVQNEKIARNIRATFVDLHSITKENLTEILDLIDDKSEDYVLKPQREGGGNNIYKNDIRLFVDSLKDKSDLMGYILMRLVDPYINKNYIVRNFDELFKKEMISELGIFGYYISKEESLVENETGGYLLRTKSFGVNEGGVASGYSALDSLCLI